MAAYENLRSEGFASNIQRIRRRYYNPNGSRKYSGRVPEDVELMYQLIDDLDEYTVYGHRVDNFTLGDKSSYLKRQRKAYEKARYEKGKGRPNIDLGILRGAQKAFWGAEWEHQAGKAEYRAMVGTADFLESVQWILDEIKDRKTPTIRTTDAIEQLAKNSCGVPNIDRDNQRLLDAFNKSIEEDLKVFEDKQLAGIEEKIASLRNKSLYKYNASKFRMGDNRYVGEEGKSMTFGYLFDRIRSIAKRYNYEMRATKEESYYLNKNNSYGERIKALGELIESLNAAQDKMAADRNECILNIAERERLDHLRDDIYSKIASIETLYNQIKEKEEKYNKYILIIDGLNRKIEAIDNAITTLLLNERNVFNNTTNLLRREREKCVNELKKYENLIELLDAIFDKIPDITRDIELLREPCGEIISVGRERKEKEKKEQQRIDKEYEAKMKAHEMQKEIDRQEIIDKIKDEVIRQMSFENIGPRIVNVIDADHFEEDYSEFNVEFRKRLEQAFREHNIEYTEADFSNPIEPIKPYQEREKDPDGIIKLRRSGTGYVMTYEDFDYLFEIFEYQARKHYSWNDYTYDQVIGELEDYLKSMYDNNIVNREEYEEIKRNRYELFQEKHGGHRR